MNVSIFQTVGNVCITPAMDKNLMMSGFDVIYPSVYEDLIRVRKVERDYYKLTVDLVAVDEDVCTLEDALLYVRGFGGRRRFLTLFELFILNARHRHQIRSRYPILTDRYVIDVETEDVDDEYERYLWAIGPSDFHQRRTIDPCSVFATTKLTFVDLGTFGSEIADLVADPCPGSPRKV